MIKIGPYLPKLLQEKFGAVFFWPTLYSFFGRCKIGFFYL